MMVALGTAATLPFMDQGTPEAYAECLAYHDRPEIAEISPGISDPERCRKIVYGWTAGDRVSHLLETAPIWVLVAGAGIIGLLLFGGKS